MAITKSERLEARITPEQAEVIRHATEIEGTTLTDFVVSAAMARAREVLADQRVFVLGPAAWARINAILDAPTAHKPELSRLFSEPSVFDE